MEMAGNWNLPPIPWTNKDSFGHRFSAFSKWLEATLSDNFNGFTGFIQAFPHTWMRISFGKWTLTVDSWTNFDVKGGQGGQLNIIHDGHEPLSHWRAPPKSFSSKNIQHMAIDRIHDGHPQMIQS